MAMIYCFSERRRELFAEACVRGWVAAARDFPHLKNREEATATALRECDALQSEVCCIQDENAYRLLVSSAYCSTYLAFEQLTGRESVPVAAAFKSLPLDEARRVLRLGFTDELRTYLGQAYAQFVEAAEFV